MMPQQRFSTFPLENFLTKITLILLKSTSFTLPYVVHVYYDSSVAMKLENEVRLLTTYYNGKHQRNGIFQ